MSTGLFIIYLCLTVWQDIRSRSIKRRWFLLFGLLGLIVCIGNRRGPYELLGSAAVGIALLALNYVTEGKVGEGDGWFFIVSGLYLRPGNNLLLFLSGLMFSGVYALTLFAAAFSEKSSIRKKRIPFLPFLLPMGLWLSAL